MANNTAVMPMVSHLRRIEARSMVSNFAANRDLSSSCRFMVLGRIVTPSSGAKSTATTQEINSDEQMTVNSVKVYSTRRAVVEADGHEAGNGNNRAGQHGKCRQAKA